jgi:hypothetical protein
VEDAFVGIDVCFAKRKRLPIVVCKHEGTRLVPVKLRELHSALPPQGHGNKLTLDPDVVRRFCEDTLAYLQCVEREHGLRFRRVAIDSPRAFKSAELSRRAAEVAMDQRRISCFATPSESEFDAIKRKADYHLSNGGAENCIPHANQLWMLVGFALFEVLEQHYDCIEVFPQAIATVLRASRMHKSHQEGLTAQLLAVQEQTDWPAEGAINELQGLCFGSRHDKLDAYMSAWIASLAENERIACGNAPLDVIWIPRLA